jgi:hypothetical protein
VLANSRAGAAVAVPALAAAVCHHPTQRIKCLTTTACKAARLIAAPCWYPLNAAAEASSKASTAEQFVCCAAANALHSARQQLLLPTVLR